MMLQAAAEQAVDEKSCYQVGKGDVIRWKGLWEGILRDMQAGLARPVIAARFHNTLAQTVADKAINLARQHDLSGVVLTGGVFQNGLLPGKVSEHLSQAGLCLFGPATLPLNDGGLSLGQAAIAARQKRRENFAL